MQNNQMEQKIYDICSFGLTSERVIKISEIVLLLKILEKSIEFIADVACACFMDTKIYAQALLWRSNGLKASDLYKLERKLKVFQKNELKRQENAKLNQKNFLNSLRGIIHE